MIAALVDRVDRAPKGLKTFAGLIGVGWMIATSLDYGRLIDLPNLPFITGTAGLILAGVYNAVWWGFINPRIEQHRAARAGADRSKVTVHG